MRKCIISARALITALFAVAAAAVYVVRADADEIALPTTIVRTNSPAVLTSCRATRPGILATNNVTNRSNIFLTSYVVRWTVYDHSGTAMGQSDISYRFDSDLAPNDSASQDGRSLNVTEPFSAAARVTCRLQSAKFEGGKSWTYGRSWTGKLSPMPAQQSFQSNGAGGGGANELTGTAASSAVQAPRVALSVTNAWNDTVGENLFVHVALDIKGGDAPATVMPNMLNLAMTLANGGQKSYQAMPGPAPTYEKLTPLGSGSVTAYEVDPKEDVGRLGSVIVPAHGNVHVVATFVIGSDVVANPNDNRQVTLK